jgi:hypothetical protein
MNINRACLHLWGAILMSGLTEHKLTRVLPGLIFIALGAVAIRKNKRYISGE